MRIASWNINSVRTRPQRAVDLLAKHDIDVLCLQETKVADAKFPREPFEEAGYHVTRRLPTGQADHFVLQCAVMLDILVGTRATRALAQERGTTAPEMHKEFLHLLAEDVWPSEDPDYAEEDIWEDFQYAHTVLSTLGLGTPHAFVPGEIVFKPAVKAFLYRCLTQADPQWVLPVSEAGTRD